MYDIELLSRPQLSSNHSVIISSISHLLWIQKLVKIVSKGEVKRRKNLNRAWGWEQTLRLRRKKTWNVVGRRPKEKKLFRGHGSLAKMKMVVGERKPLWLWVVDGNGCGSPFEASMCGRLKQWRCGRWKRGFFRRRGSLAESVRVTNRKVVGRRLNQSWVAVDLWPTGGDAEKWGWGFLGGVFVRMVERKGKIKKEYIFNKFFNEKLEWDWKWRGKFCKDLATFKFVAEII